MTLVNRIDQLRPDAPALAAHGPHAIGVRTLEVSNPNQIDILRVLEGQPLPRYDRPLTLEVWYPAALKEDVTQRGSYDVFLRDGKTEVTLHGRAVRDAEPLTTAGSFPLVLISHGYPGNRFLMSHLGENLATKGYVTVSIDHTDSTYNDKAAFGSTLVNRRLDVAFVLSEMSRFAIEEGHFLAGIVDSSNTGLIGYSMGGYGAVITAGGGVTETSVGYDWGAPARTLAMHQAGSERHEAQMDPRIKAVIPIAPWGMTRDVWDAEGLTGVRIPSFFMAGSQDGVSGYEDGVRAIFEQSVNAERYLLTFDHAGHNAAAPIPAPVEAWKPSPHLDFVPFEHYADPVWDTLRMNNIAQHFATAFLGKHLKGDASMDAYLDLIENAEEGIEARNDDGTPKAGHSAWKGFQEGTAKGLSLQRKGPGER
ncbi:alpha/beta hydrolase family protein [Denitrobaculum tricleocarpae]|uniref:Dienelactone hydrolase n=1 Tax=Denitrobaculum tricleocarpae TaxID=2591009 RepID=A0A545TXP5_9PROT|nr:dienelactone hydrolase [Denitrobaculum tricleocarpae]TQV81998.1 dienelactone hydrolase [Denitrobaculum tricleocarpae]